MIDLFKGKYYTAKDATKDIDIVTITKECENLTNIAEDLQEMNTKTNELQDICNGDTLRIYQNTMDDTIEKYGIKIDETACETHMLADRILSTATKIYVKRQEQYNEDAINKEQNKLRELEEKRIKKEMEKAKKEAERAKKAGKKGYTAIFSGTISNLDSVPITGSLKGEAIASSVDKSLKEYITGSEVKDKGYVKTFATAARTYKHGTETVVYNEEKVEEAQQLIEKINNDLADIDDKLYVTLRKLGSATGIELVEDANSDVDLHLPEKMMIENRSDARNMGNTLTNLVSLMNILNTGSASKTGNETQQTAAPTTAAHYTVTAAPTTAAPVAATVAQAAPATQPGTIAPPTVNNTVQARESETAMSTLTGSSGSISGSGTSTSAPTSTVLPASPVSFDSSIPDTSSNSKMLGGYAIPAAAGIAAGIGGLGVAHKIKRDKEDEALFGNEDLDQEFATEFNNQEPQQEEKKEDENEPIRDDKEIYKFFK